MASEQKVAPGLLQSPPPNEKAAAVHPVPAPTDDGPAPLCAGVNDRGGACTGGSGAWLRSYCRRMRGTGLQRAPPLPPRADKVLIAFVGSFLGMLVLTSMELGLVVSNQSGVIASFGATAVLVFAAPASPLGQPRNVIGGQIISAVVAVALRVLLVELPIAPQATFAVAALAVAVSIAAMMLTGTLHPAGSGTAYIAVVSPSAVAQGWWFILAPVALASVVIVAAGALWNNLWGDEGQPYPAYWLL